MITMCELDHLVLGAHTLEQGAAFVEAALGVKPQPGGKHVAMGTHNLLLRLGAKSYLEVIATDPAAITPRRPRWFGLDSPAVHAALRERPRLLTWVARTADIEVAVAGCPLALGNVHRMTRGAFSWRITIPDDGMLIGDGLVPSVIQWDGDAHPAEKLEDRGGELVNLAGLHPSPASIAPALAALGLETTLRVRTDLALEHGNLFAQIRTPAGIRRLSSECGS